MRLLMLSGDRQLSVGERGPFHAMLRHFQRHFERIDVLCPRPDRPASVRAVFETVHLHPAPCGRAGMARWIARRGGELIGEHGHDLIVSHDYGWFYNGRGAARLSRSSGVPYLSEIHHVPGHPIAAGWGERLARWAARRYVRWARRRALAFRVVNAGELAPLLRAWGVPPERIVVLPSLYIDLELFSPPSAPATEWQQDVLFVGRMVGNKGLERIVDALGLLAQRGQALRCLFVGRGPLRAAVEARARRRGLLGARFVDWVDGPEQLARIYRASRVLVCASTCEGGPRVTVEAMACGTPVVSTPVGMMKELLREGVNGCLCGFDAQSLAAAIERALADEPRRLEMGRAARRDALRFECERALWEYARGLHRLIGRDLEGAA